MKELFKKVSEQLVEQKATAPYFSNSDYIPEKIVTGNFCKITQSEIRKTAFIDGGNIEIVGNNNFSFQLMRIYWTIYEKERIHSSRNDYLVFVHIVNNGDIFYLAEVYKSGNLAKTFKFQASANKQRIKPATIMSSIRRIFEIDSVSEIASKLSSNDIIVLDGNLAVKNDKAFDSIEKVYDKVKKQNLMLCGLCKTSSIITDSGVSLIGYINNISPKTAWYYHPICKNNNSMHKSEMVIVKLHERSEFAFLLDIYKESKDMINDVCFNLSKNSQDPIFLGYPYGLIEADMMARCSEDEKNYLKTRFLHQDKGTIRKIKNLINTNNAHDILDNIK
jgi:SepF-like predicted cell division protein (DUF552 family)